MANTYSELDGNVCRSFTGFDFWYVCRHKPSQSFILSVFMQDRNDQPSLFSCKEGHIHGELFQWMI